MTVHLVVGLAGGDLPALVPHGADDLVRDMADLLGRAGVSSACVPVDPEDFVEHACRTLAARDAAHRSGLPLWGLDKGGTPVPLDDTARSVRCPSPGDTLLPVGLYVVRHLADAARHLGVRVDTRFHEDVPYGSNPGFVRHAGRRFVVCRHASADVTPGTGHLPLLADAARTFAGRRTVWKMLTPPLKEYPVERFVTGPGGRLPDDVLWACVHREADVSSLQDDVDMRHEYRVFVVDGRVVSGAGCVTERTPLVREGVRFDPWVRGRIGARDAPVRDDGLVAAYARAAPAVVADLLAQEGFPRHFALDLFTGPDGGVGVVELNPVGPSGLYANDVVAVVDATVRAALRPHEGSRDPLRSASQRQHDTEPRFND